MPDDLDPAVVTAAAQLVGADLHLEGRTARGESTSTFLLASDVGGFVIKLAGDGDGSLENQQRLVQVVNGLRSRGYPAPEVVGAARVNGAVFTIQRRIPGSPLEPGPGLAPDRDVFKSVLPDLLHAVDLQRDAGDLDTAPWPTWLLNTIERGGDGYCLHATMRSRPDTSALLDRLRLIAAANSEGAVRTTDAVHFDLNPANILQDDGRLVGIVDWTIPFTGAGQGDRGFDVATLLFYTYDLDATRAQLWDAAFEISGPAWIAVYLCHLVLRQVEWSMRHRPGSDEERRFIAIASAVLDDVALLPR